jgi:protein-S-isoprenylcysteine O-methyltransferase Ste14
MTLPFAGYVVMLFTNFPINIILDLKRKKNRGLVTSGPYRFIRHPQYLGMILVMLASTSWSVWILTNTFGMGFLTPTQTIGVWVFALLAYIVLAYLEEQTLSRQFGVVYTSYQRQTPFLIPFIKPQKKEITLLGSILIPILLLAGLIAS